MPRFGGPQNLCPEPLYAKHCGYGFDPSTEGIVFARKGESSTVDFCAKEEEAAPDPTDCYFLRVHGDTQKMVSGVIDKGEKLLN